MSRQHEARARRSHQFGRELLVIRRNLGMNQQRIAAELGIAQPTWSQGENGRSNADRVVDALCRESRRTLPLTWNELELLRRRSRMLERQQPRANARDYPNFEAADADARRLLNIGKAGIAGVAITWMERHANGLRERALYHWRRGNWYRDRGRWEDALAQLHSALILLEYPDLRGDAESERMWVQVHLSLAQTLCNLGVTSSAAAGIDLIKTQDRLSPFGEAALAVVEAEHKASIALDVTGRDRERLAQRGIELAQQARCKYEDIAASVKSTHDTVSNWRRAGMPAVQVATMLNGKGVLSLAGKEWKEQDVLGFDLKTVHARQYEVASSVGWAGLVEGRALLAHPDAEQKAEGRRILSGLKEAFGSADHGEIRNPDLYVWSWYWLAVADADHAGQVAAAREAESRFRIGGIRRCLKRRRLTS